MERPISFYYTRGRFGLWVGPFEHIEKAVLWTFARVFSWFLIRAKSINYRNFWWGQFMCHCEAQPRSGCFGPSQSQVLEMYYTYIMTNLNNNVLYTGVTNDLKVRVYQHKEKLVPGFTKRYKINKLVYYEWVEDIESAIQREKQIKNLGRIKKIELVRNFNQDWDDLYERL